MIFPRPLLSDTFYSDLEERSEFFFTELSGDTLLVHAANLFEAMATSRKHQAGWKNGLAETLRNKTRTIAKLYPLNV